MKVHTLPTLRPATPVLLLALAACAAVTGPAMRTAGVPAAIAPAPSSMMPALQKASRAFVENRGQWDAQAQFLARSPGVDSWVTERGVVYDFHRFVPDKDAKKNPMDPRGKFDAPKGRRQGHVVRMEFVGGKPSAAKGEGLLEGRYNYFIGNDESKWASNVPRYSEVRSEQVYDGIEARWYFDQGKPRYDLIVAPGADPSKIQMRFAGASGLSTDGKSLSIGTSLGNVEQAKLFAYQKIDGSTKQVPCAFVARGNTASFQVGAYDSSRPLVIDPLIWSTFLGGGIIDAAYSVALDSSGAAVVGETYSTDFPTTVGAYDQTYNGSDAFVAKLSTDGSTLLYSTFVGGSNGDPASSVALDPSGDAVVAGTTDSTDFPTTAGAYNRSHNLGIPGGLDAYVLRLSADGGTLLYSTFLGGIADEYASSVVLDSSGNAVVVGSTSSSHTEGFPTTVGAYDPTFNGGTDAFVSKLSADGSSLLYSTFLGGSIIDYAKSVALDSSGDAVVAGATGSSNFPSTAGAYDQVPNGEYDAFVARFSADGSSLLYSTFLGGTDQDFATSVALDSLGNAVIAGRTSSSDFPTTLGAYDQSYNGGVYDAFVSKLSADGSSLAYSMFLGGIASDFAYSTAVDFMGNAVVAGYTVSSDFPTTAGAYDQTYSSGEAYISRLSPDGSSLPYSTFLGGSASTDNVAYSVALDSAGNAVVAGRTSSSDFPTTLGAYDQAYNGNTDAFVSRVATAPALMDASVPKNTFVGGFSVPMTVTLNQPASLGNAVVALSTDTPGKVFVSQTKVKAGKSTKTFGVRTETVKVDTPVSVTATLNGVSKTVNFTLKPGGLLSVKLTPTSLSSLQFGYGRVTVSSPAPADGRSVALDSSRSDLFYVPQGVDVESGLDSAVFPTYAGPISTPTLVTVTARLGTMKKTASITLNP